MITFTKMIAIEQTAILLNDFFGDFDFCRCATVDGSTLQY